MCNTCRLTYSLYEPHLPCRDCGAKCDWRDQSSQFEELWNAMQIEGKNLNSLEVKTAMRLAWLGGFKAGRDEPKGGI